MILIKQLRKDAGYLAPKLNNMNDQEYYKELGRLLYAIAKVDGKVQQKESEELHRIVKTELLKIADGKDEYDTAIAYTTEFEFDMLREREWSSEEAFESFAEFIRNRQELSPKLKTLAYRSAEKVADSFHGTNTREAELLERLNKLLQQNTLA